jgi:hypothetical protein
MKNLPGEMPQTPLFCERSYIFSQHLKIRIDFKNPTIVIRHMNRGKYISNGELTSSSPQKKPGYATVYY